MRWRSASMCLDAKQQAVAPPLRLMTEIQRTGIQKAPESDSRHSEAEEAPGQLWRKARHGCAGMRCLNGSAACSQPFSLVVAREYRRRLIGSGTLRTGVPNADIPVGRLSSQGLSSLCGWPKMKALGFCAAGFTEIAKRVDQPAIRHFAQLWESLVRFQVCIDDVLDDLVGAVDDICGGQGAHSA